LWIGDIATGESHALTTAKKSSTSAAWSPDGKWIAFLSDRPGQIAGTPDGKQQLYLISPDGGEAQQLTKVEKDVNALEWAPDSKRIAFSMSDPDPKSLKDRKEKYGEYSIVHSDYQMTHLWTIEISPGATPTEEPKRLTEGDKFSVGSFSWSPDGTRIAFSAQKDPDLISSESADLYVVTIDDRAVKKIVSTPGPDTSPKWSPDGKKIAFETAAGSRYFFYSNSKIAVVAADGGAPQILTETFDEDPGLVAWGPDGIYFTATQKTASHLFRLNPATGSVEKLSAPENMVAFSFSFSRDYKQAVYRASLENQFGEIYTSSVAPWAPRKLTAMGDQLKGFALAHREVISWKSTDGTAIEGVLYTPPNMEAGKKYP
jgi:Tol biopolymer transport system component